MNIIPTRIQEQIGQVDRTRSLVIGISAGSRPRCGPSTGCSGCSTPPRCFQRGLVARLAGLPPGAGGASSRSARIRWPRVYLLRYAKQP